MGAGVVKDTLTPGLAAFAKRFPDIVGAALMAETEVETTEVIKRTPIDKGPLRSTVKAEGPFREGRRIYSQISAGGGPAADYAIIQHEDLELWHDEGEAKFVESVILESRAYIAARVARRIQFS